MILDTLTSQEVAEFDSNAEVLSSTPMAVSMDNPALIMSLLSNLYNDPDLAVIREYTANGFDAHTAINLTTPISVHAPTKDSPIFTVTDSGIGMSREDMETVYGFYGKSTKNGSNDEIGGYGLGCKSGLAITNQFSVRSTKDGYTTLAIIRKSNESFTSVDILSHEYTEKPSGTVVSIPVENAESFSNKLAIFMNYVVDGSINVINKNEFNDTHFSHISHKLVPFYSVDYTEQVLGEDVPAFVTVYNEEFVIDHAEGSFAEVMLQRLAGYSFLPRNSRNEGIFNPDYEFTHYTIRNIIRDSNGIIPDKGVTVVMGGIPYHISDTDMRSNVFSLLSSSDTEIFNSLLDQKIVIDLPIGAVSLSPNRESVQFTSRTSNVIVHAIKVVLGEMSTVLNEKIETLTSLREVYNFARNNKNLTAVSKALGKPFIWRGLVISGSESEIVEASFVTEGDEAIYSRSSRSSWFDDSYHMGVWSDLAFTDFILVRDVDYTYFKNSLVQVLNHLKNSSPRPIRLIRIPKDVEKLTLTLYFENNIRVTIREVLADYRANSSTDCFVDLDVHDDEAFKKYFGDAVRLMGGDDYKSLVTDIRKSKASKKPKIKLDSVAKESFITVSHDQKSDKLLVKDLEDIVDNSYDVRYISLPDFNESSAYSMFRRFVFPVKKLSKTYMEYSNSKGFVGYYIQDSNIKGIRSALSENQSVIFVPKTNMQAVQMYLENHKSAMEELDQEFTFGEFNIKEFNTNFKSRVRELTKSDSAYICGIASSFYSDVFSTNNVLEGLSSDDFRDPLLKKWVKCLTIPEEDVSIIRELISTPRVSENLFGSAFTKLSEKYKKGSDDGYTLQTRYKLLSKYELRSNSRWREMTIVLFNAVYNHLRKNKQL